MTDTTILQLLHAFKVTTGEWAADHKPTVRELSVELRAMGRLDVASRVEEGRTVFALRD
jgi:hypothetical protein